MRQLFYRLALIALMFFYNDIESYSGTTATTEVAIFIGHLNPDCRQDTVFAESRGYGRVSLPTSIHWGVPSTSSSVCPTDTMRKNRANHRITGFHYPNWLQLGGNVAFTRVNQDTLNDIILFMYGRTDTTGKKQSRDTNKIIVLYGGIDLRQEATLNIVPIWAKKDKPIPSKRLVRGENLAEPGYRDISGKLSYVLLRSQDSVRISSTDENSILFESPMQANITTNVYPNPSAGTTTIEVKGLLAGNYTISVLSIQGRELLLQEIEVNTSGILMYTLETENLSSGCYIARIYTGATQIAAYPLLIIR